MKNKNFFSLIHTGELTLGPGKKVFSSSEIEKVLELKQVIQTVQDDAKKYKENVIAETETIKEQAELEGFTLGFEKWAEQLAALENNITSLQEEMQKMIVPLAMEGVKKLFSTELKTNEDALVSLIQSSLKKVSQHKQVKISVCKEDYEVLSRKKEELKIPFEKVDSFSLGIKNDLANGDCVIETEGGIINARMANKWQLLEQAFTAIVQQQQEGKESD